MQRVKTSLSNVEFEIATGNFDTSRTTIDRLVLHTTASTKDAAIQRFASYGTQVSAHYIVDLDGTIYHGLEEYWTAYHSGNYAMNQRSIGIEHVDNGNYNDPRPDILYETSAKLVVDICKFYGIPIDREHILDHRQVVPTGCPDALDTNRIIARAQQITTPPPLSDADKLANIRSVCYGSGWSWQKIAKIKQILG